MSIKKYRFAVGNCGPTILYTKTIYAENAESAAKTYLSGQGKDLSDENIKALLKNVHEIVPREKPEKIMDYLEREIVLGDEVVFIRNRAEEPPKLMLGRVEKISDRSIVVKTSAGESNRIFSSEDDFGVLSRVIIMTHKPERMEEGVCDAVGYPVKENDIVAFMKPISNSRCDGFQTGVVSRITESFISVNETRRAPNRVVVIN